MVAFEAPHGQGRRRVHSHLNLRSSMANPLLDVDSITVRRGMSTVLDNLSIHLEKGETVALLGRNGSGKSTLLEACARLLPIESGSIHHDKVSVVRPDGARSVSPVVVGVTLQKNGSMGSETVQEHLKSAMSAAGATTDLLPFLGGFNLSHRRSDAMAQLSQGQARKVAVLAGLLPAFVASTPALVLLDEPSTGLDTNAKAQLIEWMEQLRSSGHALLISTHDQEVLDACTGAFEIQGASIRHEADSTTPPNHAKMVSTTPCKKERGGAFGVRHQLRTQAWLTHNGVAGLLTLGLLVVLGDVNAALSSTQSLGLVLAPAMAIGLSGDAMVNLGREERTHDWRQAVGLSTPHSSMLPLLLGGIFTAMASQAIVGEAPINHVMLGGLLSIGVAHSMRYLQHSVDRLARPNAVFVGLLTPVMLLPYALLIDWLG